MKINFMKDAVVDELKNNIKKNILRYDQSKNDWINKEWLKEFKEVRDFSLDISKEKPEDTDFDNIRLLYLNLRDITDSQAGDERLWVGLSHDKFWGYMQYRWPLKKAAGEEDQFIKKNYFFAHGSTRSLMTNGLARLWWTGRLTYDEDAKDSFILTKYLCKDLNGRGFPLLAGSNYSNNKNLLKNLLYILMEYEEKEKLTREEFLEVVKRMNLWGGKIILDSLNKEDLKDKIGEFLKYIKGNKKFVIE